MKKAIIIVVFVVVVTSLSACVRVSKMLTVDAKLAEAEAKNQRVIFIEQLMEDQAWLHRVAYPIFRRNAELCEIRVRLMLG